MPEEMNYEECCHCGVEQHYTDMSIYNQNYYCDWHCYCDQEEDQEKHAEDQEDADLK
tara:strand:- start:1440 stop:1610 length:171 start_codon:yes stop_codon:yes gene_type:complete